MKIIGVIGAGASGLCAARNIQATPGLTVVVWEQSAQLGGTWRMSEDVETDKRGLPVHSSMYQSLRCDLPKVMMGFPEFAFPEGGGDFAHHTEVLEYLENYAKHFNILQYIKFGSHVEKIHPIVRDDGQPPSWEVSLRSFTDGSSTTTTCDALMICTGHFSVPRIPDIDGIKDFKGRKIHSHDYREPSPFTGKRVIVLGAGASGLDISMELSTVAEHVYLSHNFPVMIPSEFPPNITQIPCVKRATHNGFYLNNEQFISVDIIFFCTGYEYKFPFLSDECGIQVENNQVKPLYKHIVNALHPSMGFIGIPSRIIVLPLVNYQVRYFLATVTGQVELPAYEEIMAAIEASLGDLKLKGRKEKDYHILHSDQWQYMEDLALCTGVEQPPPYLKRMWGIVIARLLMSFPIFKTYSYRVGEDGAVIESRNGVTIHTGWDLTFLSIKQLLHLLWRDSYRVLSLLGSMLFKSFAKIVKKN